MTPTRVDLDKKILKRKKKNKDELELIKRKIIINNHCKTKNRKKNFEANLHNNIHTAAVPLPHTAKSLLTANVP
jgi:hypothetical protein